MKSVEKRTAAAAAVLFSHRGTASHRNKMGLPPNVERFVKFYEKAKKIKKGLDFYKKSAKILVSTREY
ncbi:hypothetical protein [Zongyangia hominis]|uniref:Uncharacterized protein n=1 Tax=Zongyangia hominis TaxID=2763677 RepID=A0A926IB62_9FIRM|nr:hypothetical protein [Zongyangia hominis]MBC8569790.1 hypothetical protein [Zongyangia hominis]